MLKADTRFWIVGGEYDDQNFERLVRGTERLVGPFANRTAAEHAWRDLATATRPSCYTRFAIAEEPAIPRARAKA